MSKRNILIPLLSLLCILCSVAAGAAEPEDLLFQKPPEFERGGRGTVLPDSINYNMHLTANYSPYIAEVDFKIGPEATLWIDPGVELHMAEGTSILVHGCINAIGGEGDLVVIRAAPGASSWGALCIFEEASPCRFSYMDFSGATEGPEIPSWFSGISSLKTDLDIDHCLFQHNHNCIYVYDANLTVRDCEFLETNGGESVYLRKGTLVVERCFFERVQNYGDAIDINNVDDARVQDCLLMNAGGDLVDVDLQTTLVLIGNTFIGCGDSAVDIEDGSHVTLIRNSFADCPEAVSLSRNSEAHFDQCTFHNNDIALFFEPDPEGRGRGLATIKNSIFSENDVTLIIDVLSTVTITYCLSDAELLEGEGNIMDNPLLAAPSAYDYELMPDSPCIDAGDPDDPFQSDSTIVDMGVRQFFQVGAVLNINEINYNSSPAFNPGDWVEFRNRGGLPLDMSGMHFRTGESVGFEFPEGTIINAYDYLILCRDQPAFESCFPAVEQAVWGLNFDLVSTADISLITAEELVVDLVSYDCVAPWPSAPDGGGATLELINPGLDHTLPTSWGASTVLYGTPGEFNSNSGGTAVDDDGIAVAPQVLTAYPNPFNPTTTIVFTLDRPQDLRLSIHDVEGRRVAWLINGPQDGGRHEVLWDGRDDNGISLGSGLYLVHLQGEELQLSRKLLLVK
ncbi:MAG: T9SS type A sorting domain-containing protein [bacterium]|nr:T9SS type A sorting domain-containing protein [bacterium]